MRLWTLHPKYLDAKGIVSLWREALLAQEVLAGKTYGYTHHPQLIRFRNSGSPESTIGYYLKVIYDEALSRDYIFDRSKINSSSDVGQITVTSGQLEYEWIHLKSKLQKRSPHQFIKLKIVIHPEPHPLFRIIAGPVEEWEKI